MENVTIRIWEKTRRKLRILAAIRGKPMVAVLDDLVSEALKDAGYENSQSIQDRTRTE